MIEIQNLADQLWPDSKAVIYAISGFLLNMTWIAFRGRRIAVTWTAVFQTIKPVGIEPATAKVTVLVNDKPAPNLQTCRVTVTNDSSRDIERMDLLFTFYDPFVIADSNANLESSAKNLLHTEKYQNTLKAVMDTPEAQRTAHTSFSYLIKNREYHLPALNRGESATFAFWINSPNPTDVPKVWVTSEKAGIRLISRRADIRWMDYAIWKPAALIGIPIALILAGILSQTTASPLIMCVGAALAGVFASVMGLLIMHLLKLMRRIV